MSELKRVRFSTTIAAPPARVHELMLRSDTFQDWTSAFAEGSRFEGSWERGARIRFMAPSVGGMVAEIAEHRPGEFVSIRHLGPVADGEEIPRDPPAWADAYENYTFKPASGGGTELLVEQDATPDFEQFLVRTWPEALQRLKRLCESPAP